MFKWSARCFLCMVLVFSQLVSGSTPAKKQPRKFTHCVHLVTLLTTCFTSSSPSPLPPSPPPPLILLLPSPPLPPLPPPPLPLPLLHLLLLPPPLHPLHPFSHLLPSPSSLLPPQWVLQPVKARSLSMEGGAHRAPVHLRTKPK